MQTILVPTDFSKAAENAMWYAVEMAKKTKARLMLLHVYQFPYISPEIPGTITTFEEIEADCNNTLKKLIQKIRRKHGYTTKADYAFRNGTVTEEINRFAGRIKPDLIVAGMQGAGYISQRLMGSTATTLVRTSKYPVLTIGKTTKFKVPKSIALAYDYQPVKKSTIDKLKTFSSQFKSLIAVVHVTPEAQKLPNKYHMNESKRLEKMLGAKNITFYYVEDTEVSNGLNRFVKNTKTDLVTMFPHRHSFFARLIKEPYTKKMAFHSKAPLLTIPG